MAHLIVKYGPNGERDVEAFGFPQEDGSNPEALCRKASRFVVEVLGSEGDVEAKVDWHVRNDEQARFEQEEFGYDPTKICG